MLQCILSRVPDGPKVGTGGLDWSRLRLYRRSMLSAWTGPTIGSDQNSRVFAPSILSKPQRRLSTLHFLQLY